MTKAKIIKHPVEQIGINIKRKAWFAIIESLVVLIFGILIVVWPNITILVAANILGVIFIASGIYQIINYFVVKGQTDFFNNGLLAGVLSLIVGIAAIVIGEDLANIFRIVIGIWLIYESLVRMNTAIKLHAVGVKAWSYILIIAICMLVVGIFITFNTGAVMMLIGWMMILSGIFSIVSDVMFIQYVDTVTDAITGKNKKEE